MEPQLAPPACPSALHIFSREIWGAIAVAGALEHPTTPFYSLAALYDSL